MKKRRISYRKVAIFGLFLVSLLILSLFVVMINFKKNVLVMDNLVGKRIEKAEELVDKYSFKLEIKEEYNDDIEKGLIISQSINPGVEITKDMILKIVVSKGKIDKTVYEEYKVDELGLVPIMMYHGIEDKKNSDTKYTGGNVDKDGYNRTKEAFINDLEFYYQNGYRMIRLIDYVNGIIDVELGKSPIVLTFDDGNKNNINILGENEKGDLIIDPSSAVGILESFKKKYPDFNVTATFFLNGGLFEQPKYNVKIIKWLIDNGYDIGNHTFNHKKLDTLSSDMVQYEVGKSYKLLDDLTSGKAVNIVALPHGIPDQKTHENFQYILNGEFEGFNYSTVSTLRVGWQPDYSPFSKSFDKEFIKRVRAYDNNGKDWDIEYTFKDLENKRYISDGDKDKIVFKESDVKYLNEKISLEVISY